MTQTESTASFLDKTDWRKTIHHILEACVYAEGTEYYPRRVKSLVSASAAHYPGWDASEKIYRHIKILNLKYKLIWNVWIKDNQTKSKWVKYQIKKEQRMDYNKEIFEFIKNLLAVKRMLLWGSKSIGGGTQLED